MSRTPLPLAHARVALAALLSLVCGTFLPAPQAAAQAREAAPLESRLAALETLIERSSAARQIDASATPAAVERRTQARAALRAAQAARVAGDAGTAEKQLAEARRLMVEAARLAAPGKLDAEKAAKEFDARLESVRALLAAQQRVSAEKGGGEKAHEAARAAQQRIDEALRLRGEGRMPAARQRLDEAYLIAKASVGALRSGDTLVRSLNFATKEEEYHYEIDRNDTHQMLVRVLLQGKPAGVEALAAPFVERARALRAQAEEAARRGEHAAAIRVLEESTADLVKAIRGAGVYIPG